MKDNIFDVPQEIADFSFDARTAAVFPDMIKRSIPGYATLLQLLAIITQAQKPKRVYDLGCALGAVSLAVANQCPQAEIIALDNSEAMVQRLQLHLDAYQIPNIKVQIADICAYEYSPAEVFIANFTLQFIPPEKRSALLEKIAEALPVGGILLLAEKTQQNKEWISWHEQFKRLQGYSDLAIAQKRAALENVMLLDDGITIEKRFSDLGFKSEIIFQALAFKAWIARKL